jgi:hypothetical protein
MASKANRSPHRHTIHTKSQSDLLKKITESNTPFLTLRRTRRQREVKTLQIQTRPTLTVEDHITPARGPNTGYCKAGRDALPFCTQEEVMYQDYLGSPAAQVSSAFTARFAYHQWDTERLRISPR